MSTSPDPSATTPEPDLERPAGSRRGPEAHALTELAAELRTEGPVIEPHVADPGSAIEPTLGILAAAGPRCKSDPLDYALVIESVREGYLLHYGTSRLLAAADPDLRLLVGDHLYARGIERLVALGDLVAVRQLSTLISLVARLHATDPPHAAEAECAWLAAVVAVAVGPTPQLEHATDALRADCYAQPLWNATRTLAGGAGLDVPLTETCEAVGFRPEHG